MKPLIGVTTSELRPGELATLRRRGDVADPEIALGTTYVHAVEMAGAVPVVVPPLALANLSALVERLDGVLLSGGPDLAPEAYEARPHAQLGPTASAVDAFEYALVQEALRRGLPILGICRGAQTLNVARGGTLHQHLPDIVGGAIVHRQDEDACQPTHVVDVGRGTRLAGALGVHRLCVNSFHHQAVASLGRGLRVCARAQDGAIEAIEDPGRPLVLGVQWHAETLVAERPHRALFEQLVAVAAGPSRRLHAA